MRKSSTSTKLPNKATASKSNSEKPKTKKARKDGHEVEADSQHTVCLKFKDSSVSHLISDLLNQECILTAEARNTLHAGAEKTQKSISQLIAAKHRRYGKVGFCHWFGMSGRKMNSLRLEVDGNIASQNALNVLYLGEAQVNLERAIEDYASSLEDLKEAKRKLNKKLRQVVEKLYRAEVRYGHVDLNWRPSDYLESFRGRPLSNPLTSVPSQPAPIFTLLALTEATYVPPSFKQLTRMVKAFRREYNSEAKLKKVLFPQDVPVVLRAIRKVKRLTTEVDRQDKRVTRLKNKVSNLEQQVTTTVNPWCAGGRRLWKMQNNLEENGFASLKEWQAYRAEVIAGQIYYVGSHEETAGNSECQMSLVYRQAKTESSTEFTTESIAKSSANSKSIPLNLKLKSKSANSKIKPTPADAIPDKISLLVKISKATVNYFKERCTEAGQDFASTYGLLLDRHNRINLEEIEVPYDYASLKAVLLSEEAINWRIMKKLDEQKHKVVQGEWSIHASFSKPSVPIITSPAKLEKSEEAPATTAWWAIHRGVIGLDFNENHIAIAETDAGGHLLVPDVTRVAGLTVSTAGVVQFKYPSLLSGSGLGLVKHEVRARIGYDTSSEQPPFTKTRVKVANQLSYTELFRQDFVNHAPALPSPMRIPLPLRDKEGKNKSSTQREAILSDAVALIVQYAKKVRKPIIIEDLDFAQKKRELVQLQKTEALATRREQLSSFAYSQYLQMLKTQCRHAGVELIKINPAYTSVQGQIVYAKKYGLTVHQSAAYVIARRGMGFVEPCLKTCNGQVPFQGRLLSITATENEQRLYEQALDSKQKWAIVACAIKRVVDAEYKKLAKARKARKEALYLKRQAVDQSSAEAWEDIPF